uniref:Uncharacterized protein n=1 Tax=Physcomitrium patens TaxID=3218 RepID=A0A2K1ID63_PHYPA|nr:hypothetical protein PHYPA_030688 [Physcomitrium patens]
MHKLHPCNSILSIKKNCAPKS